MKSGILCSGAIIYDTLVRPVEEPRWGTTTFVDTIEAHTGGNGANTSLALATLGASVRLAGIIGDDDAGRFVLRALTGRGVDVSAIQLSDAPTAATVALVSPSGARKFLHRLGASAKAFLAPMEFTPDLIAGMSHYHLASLFILPNFRAHAPETLRRARAAGLTTSLDTNWDPAGRWMQDIEPCLPHLDILFVNEDEAEMLTGSKIPAVAAARLLQGGVRMAVMKLGERGCAIYGPSQNEVHCPAYEVECRDTTGAGDCFVAGFLAARLRGETTAQAGTFANAVGALSVQQIGAVTGVRSYQEVETWMNTVPLRQPASNLQT